MSVATMNIKDAEVHRLARELAERLGTSMTGAVRRALEEALERQRAERSGIAERLLEISARYVPEPGYPLTDDDLYDEDGLPR